MIVRELESYAVPSVVVLVLGNDASLAVVADAVVSGAKRVRFTEVITPSLCEKPTAVETSEALRLARLCENAKIKNGVVQDKLWLPGMRKIQMLKQQGFFGKILSVRR